MGFVWHLWCCVFVVCAVFLSHCGTPAYACPVFVEFFPDPVEVSDQEGEFVEIRLHTPDEILQVFPDSLTVQFENKVPLRFAYPEGERLVLVHDSLQCPPLSGVSCGLLGGLSLPNSRESVWRLSAGECLDSALLPKPKPGKSLQRIKETDNWTVVEPTPGEANPYDEYGVVIDSKESGSLYQLVFSEIHHCPSEPEPEWVEVYNASVNGVAMRDFSFCGKKKNWSESVLDSIFSFESVVFTKDSALLREFLGFRDVRIVQYPMGYLNNTSGSISICKGDLVIDSVFWDKNTAKCPAGFNPLTKRSENTPGFQGHSDKKYVQDPFTYKLSSRVVRLRKTPLRVYVESDYPVSLKLLDSSGRAQWKFEIPSQSSAWWNVPVDSIAHVGIVYLTISVGRFEKMVGILVRP
jgi:hypothetical protein